MIESDLAMGFSLLPSQGWMQPAALSSNGRQGNRYPLRP
jgi:hypothetical protein